MASGNPDWVRQMVISVVVNNVPVSPSTAVERAAGATGRYSGTGQTYQSVATWTVATGKVGELKEILCLSSLYAKTHLKVTAGAIVYATDWIASGALPIIFEDLKLAAGTVIKVEAQSTDGTGIVVDGVIVGKEIG